MLVLVARGTAVFGESYEAGFRKLAPLFRRSMALDAFEAGVFAAKRMRRVGTVRVDK